jgi:hypothetical protein
MAWADKDDDPLPPVRPPDGVKVKPQKPERELKEIVREIDHRTSKLTSGRLPTSGPHTESSQTDPNQGIGAATKYVLTRSRALPPRREAA